MPCLSVWNEYCHKKLYVIPSFIQAIRLYLECSAPSSSYNHVFLVVLLALMVWTAYVENFTVRTRESVFWIATIAKREHGSYRTSSSVYQESITQLGLRRELVRPCECPDVCDFTMLICYTYTIGDELHWKILPANISYSSDDIQMKNLRTQRPENFSRDLGYLLQSSFHFQSEFSNSSRNLSGHWQHSRPARMIYIDYWAIAHLRFYHTNFNSKTCKPISEMLNSKYVTLL